MTLPELLVLLLQGQISTSDQDSKTSRNCALSQSSPPRLVPGHLWCRRYQRGFLSLTTVHIWAENGGDGSPGALGKELPLHETQKPRWVPLSGQCEKIIARVGCESWSFVWGSLQLCWNPEWRSSPLGYQSLEKAEDASLDKDVGSALSDLDQVFLARY